MKFEEVLPALREGKKVIRGGFEDGEYIFLSDKGKIIDERGIPYPLDQLDLFINDWEVIEGPWKPRKGQEYWFVDTYFTVHRAHNLEDAYDTKLIDTGNCFKTETKAQQAAEKFKQLLKEIKEND